MTYWEAILHNGYCGCDVVEHFEAENEFEAERYAEDLLDDYAEGYSNACFGMDLDYSEDEWDEYRDNCYYDLNELTEEEFNAERYPEA